MSSVASTCTTCGGPVQPDKPCPRCLLKAAMGDTVKTPPGGAPPAEATPTVKSPPGGTGPRSGPVAGAGETLPLATLRGLEILEPLGRGGMGQVYRARQIELNRIVAVKVLPPRLAEDPEFLERFRREAQALAALDHPNIVRVFDCGAEAGQTYIVMEFVDGPSLRDLMRKGLKPEEALALIPPICEALEYAHGEGVVHRDIKPENILVDKKGRVKIADFGLAKILRTHGEGLTQTREVMGTPHYMAPEQFERPKEVDHRADIYALGVVFYEMLTGELPIGRFAAPSKKARIDVRLDEVVLKALEKEPQLRYQRASEVREEVSRITTSPGGVVSQTPAATGHSLTVTLATGSPNPQSGAPGQPRRPVGSNLVLWLSLPGLALLFFFSARSVLLRGTSWEYHPTDGEAQAMMGFGALCLGLSFLAPAFRRFLGRWKLTVFIAVVAMVLAYKFSHPPREEAKPPSASYESRVLWRRSLAVLPADLRFSSLVATGRSLYLSTPGGILEFDRATGEDVGQWEATARFDPPLLSESLLVWTDGNQIFVQDTDRRPLEPRAYGFRATGIGLARPTVQKGIAYGGGSGLAYAMDLSSGEVKWQVATSIPIQNSPAVFARDVKFFHDDGSVSSVDRASASNMLTSGGMRVNDAPARKHNGPPFACGDLWALPVKVLSQQVGPVNAADAGYGDRIEFWGSIMTSPGTVTLEQGERILGSSWVFADDTLVFCTSDSVVGVSFPPRFVSWRVQTGSVVAGPVQVGNGYVAVHSTMSRSGIYVIRCRGGDAKSVAVDDLQDTRALAAFDRTIYALDRDANGTWRLSAVSLGLGGSPDPPAEAGPR